MMQTAILLLVMFFLPVLSPGHAAAQVSPPVRIGGTITLDGVVMTPDTAGAVTVEVLREDGSSYAPQAVDDDGLAADSNWYLLDIPIYHPQTQEGGARPGETGVLHVTRDGRELTITSPVDGKLTVGESGTNTVVNIIADSGGAGDLPPEADAGDDQTVTPGATVRLDGTASTAPGGGALVHEWVQTEGVAVVLSDAGSATPSFTAPALMPEEQTTLIFRLTVKDGAGQTDEDTVSILVRATPAGNASPAANAGNDRAVASGDVVQLDGSGSTDPDGDALTYHWTQTAGTKVSLSGATGVTAGFIAPAPPGEESLVLTFSLKVSDPSGASDTDTVVIQVAPAVTDYPPIADAGPDITAEAGEMITLDGSNSTDPDSPSNGIVSYSWRQIDGVTVDLQNSRTARPYFLAPASAGSFALTFELTVEDKSGKTAADLVNVNISSHLSPVADAGEDQLALSGDQVFLDGSGSADEDGNIISWSWGQISGALVNLSDPLTASPSFFAPQVDEKGETLRFELTVTDDAGLRHSDTVTINILSSTGSGAPPVADAGEDQTVMEGTLVQLDGSGSHDPDGEIRMLVWSQVAGPLVTLSDARLTSPEFTAPDVGPEGAVLLFEITVFDNGAFQDDDRVQVTVRYQDSPPAADAGADLVVNPGEMVQLSAAGSSDADGWITGYAWTQTGGSPVSLTRPDAMEPGFVAPWMGAAAAALTFHVTVTDNDGLTAEDEVVVTVNGGVAAPPVADAGSDQEIYEGDTIVLNGSNSYARGAAIVSWLWEQREGPSVTIPEPWAAKTSIYIPPVEADTYISFSLTVMSADGMKSTDEIRYLVQNYRSGPGDDGSGCFIRSTMQ
ncbi:MAG: hypothetical protein CSB33_01650 [Desulfobacterales bacterium]|nr:MAG: hypothetical protein CSB33_01650 [Desulfobacterales bacterium]